MVRLRGCSKCWVFCSAVEAAVQVSYLAPVVLVSAVGRLSPHSVLNNSRICRSYLDFINLMAYDFHGKWERETGHNAPLYAPSSDSEWRKQLSVDHAASMWVKLGAPKDKLVIGMPTYGRTFTLTNSANFKVNAPASGGGKAGDYTKEGGFLAYYEVGGNAEKLGMEGLALLVGRGDTDTNGNNDAQGAAISFVP